jgi:2-methylcitrate dehydratase PrpD
MTKPFHAGRAAESGLVAADLVRLGWTASHRILESPTGFFHAAGGGFRCRRHWAGPAWTFSSPGVSIKPFPSGSLTHPAMCVMLRLIRANQIRADQVERRTISGRADFAKGSPSDSMSFDEVAAKDDGLVESVRKLGTIPDVRAITALVGA